MNEKFSSKKFSLMKIFQKWEKFSSKWQKIFNKVIKSSYKSLRDELAANNKIFKNFSIFCIWRTSDLTIDNHSYSIHIIYYIYFFLFQTQLTSAQSFCRFANRSRNEVISFRNFVMASSLLDPPLLVVILLDWYWEVDETIWL